VVFSFLDPLLAVVTFSTRHRQILTQSGEIPFPGITVFWSQLPDGRPSPQKRRAYPYRLQSRVFFGIVKLAIQVATRPRKGIILPEEILRL
jgi:hypothetical protein